MRNYITAKSGNASAYEQQIAAGKGSAAVGAQLDPRTLHAARLCQGHQRRRNREEIRRDGCEHPDADRASLFSLWRLRGTIRYLKGHTDLDSVKLIYGAAFKLNDMDTIQSSLEQLILATGNVDYWRGGIEIAEHQRPLSDHETLDLLRLRLLTGTMRPTAGGDDDYSQLAQIAIQLGFPGEAQSVLEKGMKAGVVTGERANRLMTMAKTQAAAKTASLAQDEAKAKTGDDLVKVGEALWAMATIPRHFPSSRPPSRRA